MNNDTKIIMVAVASGLIVYLYMRNKQSELSQNESNNSTQKNTPIQTPIQTPLNNPNLYPYYFYRYSPPSNINVSVSPK
jgi:hypothetical protein